jgi:alanine racemase
MRLQSRIIAVQRIRRGASVGYGSRWTAARDTRLGVVACGYADGYPRACGTGTPVLVDGVRTRTVGRVSMDMITVDLEPVPAARLGSEVTLWGEGPAGSRLSIDEVARAAGTIGYELMCALAARVPVSSAG